MTEEQKAAKALADAEREAGLRASPWQHPSPRNFIGRRLPEDKPRAFTPEVRNDRANDSNPIFRPVGGQWIKNSLG